MNWLNNLFGSIGSAFNGAVDGTTKILNSDSVQAAIDAGAKYASDKLGADEAEKAKKKNDQAVKSVMAWAVPLGVGSFILLIVALLLRRK